MKAPKGVTAAWSFLWGGPRSAQLQVVWRIIGLAMLLLVWRIQGDDSWATTWQVYPPEFHAMTAAALALVVLGPRLILLMFACAAWTALVITINSGEDLHLTFIADEYLVFAALPGFAVLSAIICKLEHRPEEAPPLAVSTAHAQLAQLRLWTLATLMFAALHKVNADFLDPRVSCASFVERELVKLWHVPAWLLPSPLQLLLLEGVTPILLLLYPRLGVACVLVLAIGLGHTGPFAFNTLLLGLALTFLPEDAVTTWSTRWRRLAAIVLPAAVCVGYASSALYRGLNGWYPYLVFDLVLVLVGALLVVSLRREPLAEAMRPRRVERLTGGYIQRSVYFYTALILVVNGLSPYLGVKYRYSFAMVSNLRADDSRWNSLIFPPWMRIRPDPLVHVDGVYGPDGKPLAMPASGGKLLRKGVYSPQEFKRRQEDAQRHRIRGGSLKLRYKGIEQSFEDYAYSSAMRRFVDALPEKPLFQSSLTLNDPQKCVH